MWLYRSLHLVTHIRVEMWVTWWYDDFARECWTKSSAEIVTRIHAVNMQIPKTHREIERATRSWMRLNAATVDGDYDDDSDGADVAQCYSNRFALLWKRVETECVIHATCGMCVHIVKVAHVLLCARFGHVARRTGPCGTVSSLSHYSFTLSLPLTHTHTTTRVWKVGNEMITSASGAVFYVKGLLNECLIIYMTIARERFCFFTKSLHWLWRAQCNWFVRPPNNSLKLRTYHTGILLLQQLWNELSGAKRFASRMDLVTGGGGSG